MNPNKIWELPFLTELRKDIDQAAEYYLKNYTERLRAFQSRNPLSIHPKYVHDAVWGNLSFNAPEMLLIDSPLVQRLRYIHQLGLARLVFPGATHSRFEHTLGTTYVAGRIAEKLKTLKSDTELKSLHNYTCLDIVSLVRLAAIFHDVGHLFTSHASERFFFSPAYSKYSHLHKLQKDFNREIGGEFSLGELLSAMFLTSPAVRELLTICFSVEERSTQAGGLDSRARARKISSCAACIILKLPVNEHMIGFSEVLSGSIDADKCDYLRRDSANTGVPVAVDINRIIDKLTLASMDASPPSKVWENSGTATSFDLIAIEHAAVRNIDDLAISRTLMHEKVYRHHKVATAEAMLNEALHLLDEACPELFSSLGLAFRFVDNDIISPMAERNIRHIIIDNKYTIDCEQKFKKATQFLKRIAERDLLVRCSSVNQHDLAPITEGADPADFILSYFETEDIEDGEEKSKFLLAIQKEMETIKSLLEPDDENCPAEKDLLLVPYLTSLNTQVDFAVKSEDGNKRYKDIFKLNSWQESRSVTMRQHILASSREYRVAAHLATKMVLYRDYGMSLSDRSFLTCKISQQVYNEARRTLSERQYYDNYPGLAPVSLHLSSRKAEVEELVKKFAAYEGARGYKITHENQIYSYIAQFSPLLPPDTDPEGFFEGILDVLSKLTLVSRDAIVGLIGRGAAEFETQVGKAFANSTLIPLGGLWDSAAHISYYMNDLKEARPSLHPSSALNQLLMEDYRGDFVFFDDALASGMQLLSIFQEFMGLPKNERATDEHHVDALCAEAQAKLREKELTLLFCYGNEPAAEMLKKEFNNLGLKIPRIIWGANFSDQLFSGIPIPVREAFRRVGVDLLTAKKKDSWSPEQIDKFSLGYADAQQGIIYAWNTPVFTLTALWASGPYCNNFTWKPLFPRQKKN